MVSFGRLCKNVYKIIKSNECWNKKSHALAAFSKCLFAKGVWNFYFAIGNLCST